MWFRHEMMLFKYVSIPNRVILNPIQLTAILILTTYLHWVPVELVVVRLNSSRIYADYDLSTHWFYHMKCYGEHSKYDILR